MDDLSNVVPPASALTDTNSSLIQKKTSLPAPNDEASGLLGKNPDIILSDNPQSPATIIPATDGSSTRPFKGGIAYPFSLKVDNAASKDANASTVTLQSLVITTPPAVEPTQHEPELCAEGITYESADKHASKERPEVERFFTAVPDTETLGNHDQGVDSHAETKNRPPVERFETAQEDVAMLVTGAEKKGE